MSELSELSEVSELSELSENLKSRTIDIALVISYTLNRTSQQRRTQVRTQSRDTNPAIEKIQIELLRKATVARRLELGFSLSQAALELAREGIRRANPNASKEDLNLIFVELNYGKELANHVRSYLARRHL